MAAVRPGIEVFLAEHARQLEGKRVGLVTTAAAVDSQLRAAADLLAEAGAVRLAALFAPEHGLRGDAQAGEEVESDTDPRTGLPVHSLYGRNRRPSPQMLAGLDALLCDLPDAGCRYWTFLSTMAYGLEAARDAGIPFLVLDRPNPIGGVAVEGNVLDPAFRSFVGRYPIPIRTGLTAGEVARLFNEAFGIGGELWVVPCRGWRREMWFEDTGLPWVAPSPNVPTPLTLALYPGTCLVEGTNLSEGRGTTHPFQWIGAPWLDPYGLAEDLEGRGLAGVRFRPVYFVPTFSKHQGRRCGGVQVHVTDRERLRPVAVGVHLLDAARRQAPARFRWRATGGDPFVDRLAGTDRLRRDLDRGVPPAEILAAWEEELAAFLPLREQVLLY